ncbi:plasmid pRiA4b ORF-3 family protein [Atopomonas sediminilitoris]|uniref:plasmid pRiA4b ORF-3 family protein n=1 Tax=Atopomonas sediminilitoris TaxID=2919919 RepID=UPI001F4E5ECD|nr:plasmid pRiA4b ORF-3 family protein [Atopomonas sediminilitoris]MCJ8170758.1 plasmid pRiA4b ORF-3 family protein [Atopomonas sediminilitoris]
MSVIPRKNNRGYGYRGPSSVATTRKPAQCHARLIAGVTTQACLLSPTQAHPFLRTDNAKCKSEEVRLDQSSSSLGARDDRKIKLHHVLNPDVRLRYVYDFGDAWQHVIALEDSVPWQSSSTLCEMLDGASACPPEDVGGVPGYLHFLEALQHSYSDEGREALEWVGQQFDPQHFDVRGANAAVQRICNNLWG